MVDTIIKLINLPREFSQKYTVSMHDLLHQTGYPDIADQVSVKDIYNELIVHPDLLNDWLEYSQDKRCDNGWYFKPSANNKKYLVGFLDKGSNIETEYDDKFKACATYIKKELDQIKG